MRTLGLPFRPLWTAAALAACIIGIFLVAESRGPSVPRANLPPAVPGAFIIPFGAHQTLLLSRRGHPDHQRADRAALYAAVLGSPSFRKATPAVTARMITHLKGRQTTIAQANRAAADLALISRLPAHLVQYSWNDRISAYKAVESSVATVTASVGERASAAAPLLEAGQRWGLPAPASVGLASVKDAGLCTTSTAARCDESRGVDIETDVIGTAAELQLSVIAGQPLECQRLRGAKAMTMRGVLADAEGYAIVISYCPDLVRELASDIVTSLTGYMSAVSQSQGDVLPVEVRPSIGAQFAAALAVSSPVLIVPDPQSGPDGLWLGDLADAVVRGDADGVLRLQRASRNVQAKTLLAGYLAVETATHVRLGMKIDSAFLTRVQATPIAVQQSSELDGWLVVCEATGRMDRDPSSVERPMLLGLFKRHDLEDPNAETLRRMMIDSQADHAAATKSLSTEVAQYVISLEQG